MFLECLEEASASLWLLATSAVSSLLVTALIKCSHDRQQRQAAASDVPASQAALPPPSPAYSQQDDRMGDSGASKQLPRYKHHHKHKKDSHHHKNDRHRDKKKHRGHDDNQRKTGHRCDRVSKGRKTRSKHRDHDGRKAKHKRDRKQQHISVPSPPTVEEDSSSDHDASLKSLVSGEQLDPEVAARVIEEGERKRAEAAALRRQKSVNRKQRHQRDKDGGKAKKDKGEVVDNDTSAADSKSKPHTPIEARKDVKPAALLIDQSDNSIRAKTPNGGQKPADLSSKSENSEYYRI